MICLYTAPKVSLGLIYNIAMDLLQQLYLYCILYTYSHCILHTFVVHTRFMLILRWGSYCGAAGMGGGGGERALEGGGGMRGS